MPAIQHSRFIASLILFTLITTATAILAFEPFAAAEPEVIKSQPTAKAIAAEPHAAIPRLKKAAPKLPPLSVDIAIPIRNKVRHLYVIKNPKTTNSIRAHFNVVITNNTDKPINLWREWCSWGYYNLTFEALDANGKKHTIAKGPMSWTRNFPSSMTIPPRKHRVIDVYLNLVTAKGRGSGWKMDSLLKATGGSDKRYRTIRMRPVFQIRPDDDTKAHKIWTGKVTGEYQTYKMIVRSDPKST